MSKILILEQYHISLLKVSEQIYRYIDTDRDVDIDMARFLTKLFSWQCF